MLDFKKIEDITSMMPGKYGFLIESENGDILLESNADHVFPSASTIKLFILWSIYKKISDGELSENDLIHVTDTPKVGGCGILQSFDTKNLQFTVHDIATMMIVLSDNIATNLLIDLAGMEHINREIKEYGFNDSKLERHMMDSEAKILGFDNYTSPRDQTKALRMIESHKDVKPEHRDTMLKILHSQILTHQGAQYLPLDYLFAHKTGNLDATLHDVGILKMPTGKYYVALMFDQLGDIVLGKKIMNLAAEEIFKQLRTLK